MFRTRMSAVMLLAVYAVLNVGATTYYVNASLTDDFGAGTSWGTAKKTIQAAINISAAGDSIFVTNGLYAPISTGNKAITIQSVNGATNTVIDGGRTTRCASLGSLSTHTNTVLNGFTLQNGKTTDGGGSAYGTLNNCTLSGNTASSAGGGSYEGMLNDCTLSGNTASYGGGSSDGTLNNCTLSGNTSSDRGGGSYYGTLNNCTLRGNTAASGGGGSYYGTLNNCTLSGNTASFCGGGSYYGTLNNCIVWGNCAQFGNNCYLTTMRYSCSDPMQSGSGNIGDNPMFVDAECKNFRLRTGSPCIDQGLDLYAVGSFDRAGSARIQGGQVDMGAYEGGVNGFVIAVRKQGAGNIVYDSQVSAHGDSLTFTAEETVRPFVAFYTNGVFASSSITFTWENITADGVLTAAFAPVCFFADAARPDDSSNGTSWATAKKTIQAAIDASVDGDLIVVTNGLYAPISTDNKAITIESVNGAGVTIIDGGSTTRCAKLGSSSMHTNTVLNGFTLQNGRTTSDGGGSYSGTLNNCTLSDNTAESGGGSFGGTLNNCTLSSNASDYGGGSARSTLNNCTLNGNTASSSGGGSYSCTLNNCIVWGNIATYYNNCSSTTMRYSCSDPLQLGTGNIGANPMFVDAANGNYQLSVGSPCINVGANEYVALPLDSAGNPRIANSTVDMGAYEYTSATISFDAQGGMPPVPASKSVGYGSTYGTLATTSCTGYTFAGWWTAVGGTGSEVISSTTVAITAAQTLYAKWTVNGHNVSFDAQGGVTPIPLSKSVTYASTYGTLATTSRTGYTFAGWWTETGGAGSEVTSSTTVAIAAAQTLYAKWTVNSYTVLFDAQGGAAPNPVTKSVAYASTYGTLATTSRAGYTFAGWWTEAGGTGTEVTSSTTVAITAAQTLYAKWTVNSYTVTFNAQAGTFPSPSSKIVTYASSYGTLATSTRTGYTFSGWWTGPGGTGSEVTSSTTFTITSAQTLYAKWNTDAFTVVNGADSVPIGETFAVNATDDNFGDGAKSVKLGGIGLLADGEMAGIEWTVTGLGKLAFDWMVSSEEDWDILRFYEVGGSETNQISGTGQSWSRVEVRVGGDTNAVHTFRWEYEKDPISDFVGEDCGWIDAITWSPAHELVVNNGTGDGMYVDGDVVSIDAEVPTGNWKFDQWRGDTNGLVDVFAAWTMLIMPSNAVVLTATYLPSELQQLDVFNGRGSGMYYENSLVKIIADPDPMYMEFAGWTGDDAALLNDAYAPSASFTMPTRLVSLTATYRDSIARVAGSYGHVYTEFGTEGGVSTDTDAESPSSTASVQLGGASVMPNDSFAAFETTVFGSGSATFWWRTSSEVNDHLRFLVDGVERASISGTKIPWTWFSNRVENADAYHILRWEYVKDGSFASTTDAGWVDDIVWIGDVPVPAIAPDIQATAHIGDKFKFIFWGERGIPYTVYSNATLSSSGWGPMNVEPQEVGETNGVFCYEATITPPMEQKSGFYRVMSGRGISDGDLYQTISVNPATAIHSSISNFTVIEISPASGYSYTWSLSNNSIGHLSPSSGTRVTYSTLSIPPSGSVLQTITVVGTNSNSSIKYRGTSTIRHQAQ